MAQTANTALYEYTDYRAYLKANYLARTVKNPSFSLRGFARHLGLSPAGLSRILKSDKGLSLDRAAVIAQKLGLSKKETEYWLVLVQRAACKSPDLSESLLERMNQLRPTSAKSEKSFDLSLDYFRVIAEWYHLALLEALDLDHAEFSAKTLAPLFGLKTLEVELALERLERLELIGRDTRGKYKRLKNRLLVSSRVPNEAIRKYYKQILSKALESVDAQSPTEKVIGTETFAFDRSRLEEARSLTDRYLEEMLRLGTQSRPASKRLDVYQLAVQFFRLNNKGAKHG